MYKRCFAVVLTLALLQISSGQIVLNGEINPAYSGLYAWYDGNEAIGADGVAETPVWPNRQGDPLRDITSGFGINTVLEPVEVANGENMGLRYQDVVTWADGGNWGLISENFTVMVAAAVRDQNNPYFFTGNQGGGGAEANANFDTLNFDVWTMKASFDRIETAPVVVDEFQYHTFIFSGDNIGTHYINGELVGSGDVGFAELDGFVLGGRQNGNERATVDFGEVVVFDEALSDADRMSVEGYLDTKFFGTTSLDGDFNGDEIYDCMDVDSLVAEIAGAGNDASFDLTNDGIVDGADLTEWLATAGAANLPSMNPYLVGDANLDGSVDVGDFNAWNSNKFTATAAWCSGDFNADGSVDVTDFNAWNGNKFTSSDSVTAVPEPDAFLPLLLGMGMVLLRRRS